MEAAFDFFIDQLQEDFGDNTSEIKKGARFFSFTPVVSLKGAATSMHKQFYSGNDFFLSNTVFTIDKNDAIHLVTMKNSICLLLMLEGDASILYKGERNRSGTQKSFCIAGFAKGEHVFGLPNGNYQLLTIGFAQKLLQQLATAHDVLLQLLHFTEVAESGSYWLPLFPLPGGLRKKTDRFFEQKKNDASLELVLQQYVLLVLQQYYNSLLADKDTQAGFTSIIDTAIAVRAFILQELSNELLGGLNEMSHRFSVNPKKLTSAFRLLTGKTIPAYILEQRMMYANYLLENQQMKVADVAFKCGYTDTSNFIRSYKRYFGTTPGKKKYPN